jgi:protein-tyrosine kinase
MSKIFEALKKTDGEAADFSLPLISSNTSAATVAAEPEQPEQPAMPEATAVGVDEPIPEANPVAEESVRVVSIRPAKDAPVLPFDGAHPAVSEQYRIIRTRISQHAMEPRMIVVSSAGAGEGKTVSSINIAGALALKHDASVLLLDADLRRSSIARMLGIDSTPGLTEVLLKKANLDEAIVRVEQIPNLYVLPSGEVRNNPAELLDSPTWREVAMELRKHFKYIVVDAPPMVGVADYDLIQVVCDGIVVVVRPDRSNRKAALSALDTISRDKFIGVLLNCIEDWFLWKPADHQPYYHYE